MFHTILTLSYLLPNLYLFIRIWHLFIPVRSRLLYTIIYVFLAVLYPASNFAGDSSASVPLRFLETITGYLVPFYLYLFLIVLILDIFLLLNLVLKLVRRPVIQKENRGIKSLALIISIAILIVVAGIINFNTIRISEYDITVPSRSSDIEGLKIAFVSDFHLQNRTPVKFVQKFVEKTRFINPDIMIFGGDLVEGDRDDGNLSVFEKLFKEIKTKYGVFGVLGNHEHYSGGDKGDFYGKAGIVVLKDSVVMIGEAFSLAGRNDDHSGSRLNLSELTGKANDTLPLILVDHRPTEVDSLCRYRIDIQLSGHTHDGQLFPVNLITRHVYRLSYGYRKIGHTNLFVSSGIRLWGFPVRTTGKSELLVVNVKFK